MNSQFSYEKDKFRLRPDIQIVPASGTEAYLYKASGKSFRITSNFDGLLFILATIRQWTSLNDLICNYSDSKNDASNKIPKLIQKLSTLDLLLYNTGHTAFSSVEIARFDREISYFANYETKDSSRYQMLTRLRASHVLMVGLGGLGSWTLQNLVACGVGRITGVDRDVIESSNLSRQSLYLVSDVGREKVGAARDAVLRLSEFTEFLPIEREIKSRDDFVAICQESCPIDIIILTADQPLWEISQWGAYAALVCGVPLLRGNRLGIGPLFIPNYTACPACVWPQLEKDVQNARSIARFYRTSGVGSSSALCTEMSFMGAILAHETIHFLTHTGENQTINRQVSVSSLGGYKFHYRKINKHPTCPVCGNESFSVKNDKRD